VLAIAGVPRVGERFEVGGDGADIDELGHGMCPLDRSMSATAGRTVVCGHLIIETESRISGRSPSRQITQPASLCALAVSANPQSPLARSKHSSTVHRSWIGRSNNAAGGGAVQ
jgi:hypothetical protein